jgi:hypothetical protein
MYVCMGECLYVILYLYFELSICLLLVYPTYFFSQERAIHIQMDENGRPLAVATEKNKSLNKSLETSEKHQMVTPYSINAFVCMYVCMYVFMYVCMYVPAGSVHQYEGSTRAKLVTVSGCG